MVVRRSSTKHRRKVEGVDRKRSPAVRRWPAVLLIAAGIVVFAPGFDGPFVYDDHTAIVRNPYLRQLWPPMAPTQSPVAGRPLISISLALNAAAGGLNPSVYRAWNLAIHIINALLLLGILRRALNHAVIPPDWRVRANSVAFVAALVWLIHPLQTGVIDYVTQRTESMMGLFYLLTVYAAIRHLSSRSPRWAAVAVASCFAGMACKESMVTAPIMVLLYDAAFETGSIRQSLRIRLWFYVGLATSWIVLALLIVPGPRTRSAGFSSGVSPWLYLLHQPEMILTYLRLSVWPHPLVLDYGPTLPTTLTQVLPAAAVLVMLLLASALTWLRWPRIAYAVTWFWITLSPASSIIPIGTEVGAERRIYLPLAALAVLAVVGVFMALAKLSAPRWVGLTALASVCVGFLALDLRRHREYRSEITMWQTVVERRPHGRAHYNLGLALAEAGRRDEAIAHYREALATNARGHYALGIELERQGDYESAIREYQSFVDRLPNDAQAPEGYARLGMVLAQRERWPDAISALERAVRMRPRMADAWSALADSLANAERYAEAEQAYREVLRLQPADAVGYRSYGLMLMVQRRAADAIPLFERAVALAPNDGITRLYLGNALEATGRIDVAIEQYGFGQRLSPESTEIPLALAIALATVGRYADALGVVESALHRHPADPQLRVVLENLRRSVNDRHR